MRTCRMIVVALLGAVTWTTTLAHEDTAPRRYDGDAVVRVLIETEAQLAWMHELSDDCWSEAAGLGWCDFRVSPEALARLRLMPIEFHVHIDDVQAQIDGERARLAEAAAADDADWYEDFRDFDAIVARLAELAAAHPELMTLEDIGDSLEGRDIWAATVTAPNGAEKRGMLINGTQHAREWISPMTVMYTLESLLDGYGVDPEITAILETVEFSIVPVVNPDGYVYTWVDERLWRKNRRDNGDGTMGVDLNRNWAYGFGGGGASDYGGSQTYHGAFAFSEPEAVALRDLILARPHLVSWIDFHSYGRDVLYPFGDHGGGPNDGDLHDTIGAEMRGAIQGVHGVTYSLGTVFDILYQASGIVIDWGWAERGIVSYTIELRDNSFILPPEDIIPTAEENLEAVLVLAEFSGAPIRYFFPDGRPEVVYTAMATPLALRLRSQTAAPIDPATVVMHWRYGADGPFTDVPVEHVGGEDFLTTLPAIPCGDTVEYWFGVDTIDGAHHDFPAGAPDERYVTRTDLRDYAFRDFFDDARGWTVESDGEQGGAWERGVPVASRVSPAADADDVGTGACYVTGNAAGDSDVDGGATRLVSPVVDVTGLDNPFVGYAAWVSTEGDERLQVELSNDGGATWTTILALTDTHDWDWIGHPIASVLEPTSTMVVRFTIADEDDDSLVEAGIDAVRFYANGCPSLLGDVNDDGAVNGLDVEAILAAWGACGGCDEDLDESGAVDFLDVLVVLTHWS